MFIPTPGESWLKTADKRSDRGLSWFVGSSGDGGQTAHGSPEETVFKRWEPFEALVAERGKGIRVEKVILDRSAKQIFVLLKVEEQSG